MRIGVPRELAAGETRIALVPESAKRLIGQGFSIVVEKGAGIAASQSDEAYQAAGAAMGDRSETLGADLVLLINPPSDEDVAKMKKGAVLLGLLRPVQNAELMKRLAAQGVSVLSFDLVPRISRAQSMDVLSSMATVAGYRGAILGAHASPRFFPMLMTAAGTITPATVLVIGAGVAGLQAIATARRLGAIVQSYDVRPAVKEQVESLGARFIELGDEVGGGETAGGYAKEQSAEQQQKQRELLADTIAGADVVITTAAIPGKPSPKLIDEATVARMKHGAVIVDLASEGGGNCVLTKPGETIVTDSGVIVLGPLNLPAGMPVPASTMFSRNAVSLLAEVAPKAELKLEGDSEITKGALAVHGGEILHADTRQALGLAVQQGGAA